MIKQWKVKKEVVKSLNHLQKEDNKTNTKRMNTVKQTFRHTMTEWLKTKQVNVSVIR